MLKYLPESRIYTLHVITYSKFYPVTVNIQRWYSCLAQTYLVILYILCSHLLNRLYLYNLRPVVVIAIPFLRSPVRFSPRWLGWWQQRTNISLTRRVYTSACVRIGGERSHSYPGTTTHTHTHTYIHAH